MDPRSSSTTSNRSRLSLTEVYERMRAEEVRDLERSEQEKRIRRERWEEGRQSLAHAARLRARDMPEINETTTTASVDEHVDDADVNTAADRAGTSTSPPYSPPPKLQRAPEEYEKDFTQARTAEPSTSHSLPLASQPPTENAKDEKIPSVNEDDLWKMLHLVKDVLKQPHPDANQQSEETALTGVLRLMAHESSNDEDASKYAITAPRELSEALSMDLRMEKISMEDAQYANRLDAIRKRLGALATEMTQPDSPPSEKRTSLDSSSGKEEPPALVHALSPNYSRIVLWTLTALVLLAILGIRATQVYAEHLATYTYYDPFYPVLYPVPSLVPAFLPRNLFLNVPFVAHSREAVADRIAPLDLGITG